MSIVRRSVPLVLIVSLALVVPVLAAGIPFKVDPAHSSVGFSIRHLVSQVQGKFNTFEGSIDYDAQNPAAGKVQFTVQAASIDTGNPKRDEHLRSADFFDVQKFPTLTFTSEKVAASGKDALQVTGPFTMHGVTKTITIPVKVLGVIDAGKLGGQRAGFQATFNLNRKDFGINWNKALDAGGVLLGDDVAITINVEAAANAPAKS